MAKKTLASPKTAIAYIRVSTDDQKLGPEAQRAQIEAWAGREGVTVAAWHRDDGVSGGSEIGERPGLVAALADLRAHRAGVLVAAKRDRLARDIVVGAMIQRAAEAVGARVLTADGASDGEGVQGMIMRGVNDLFAAVERETIRARTRAALATKKAKGELVGAVPYGWQLGADGRTLEPDAAEQATLVESRRLRASGLSLQAVSEELECQGRVNRAGKPFSCPAVLRMTTTMRLAAS